MSWYYNYYLGYIAPDNKIHPLGVFDDKGEIHSMFWRSRSFASDLWRNFYDLSRDSEMLSDDLKKAFSDSDGEFYAECMSYLPVDELPKGGFVKSGYFLTELKHGYVEEKDEFGYPINRPCRDYMWFAYPDYECKEYETFLIRQFVESYENCESLINSKLVVFLTQG